MRPRDEVDEAETIRDSPIILGGDFTPFLTFRQYAYCRRTTPLKVVDRRPRVATLSQIQR
jgi:hypothetical protein